MANIVGWLGNKADARIEIEVNDDLAREFMASRYYYGGDFRHYDLRLWLASNDGRNIAWDPADAATEDAICDLWDAVRVIEKASVS